MHYSYFEISNQNHHRQTGYNCNIFTQISTNLLGRNTMRLTWKLLQYGDCIVHTDYFERVEQMLITLLKTRKYLIINIQVVRIESHKHSLQIVWEYSKKGQKNGDLKEIWQSTWLKNLFCFQWTSAAIHWGGSSVTIICAYRATSCVMELIIVGMVAMRTTWPYVPAESNHATSMPSTNVPTKSALTVVESVTLLMTVETSLMNLAVVSTLVLLVPYSISWPF